MPGDSPPCRLVIDGNEHSQWSSLVRELEKVVWDQIRAHTKLQYSTDFQMELLGQLSTNGQTEAHYKLLSQVLLRADEEGKKTE